MHSVHLSGTVLDFLTCQILDFSRSGRKSVSRYVQLSHSKNVFHKEFLTPPLARHLRGHSASLRDGIPVFCLPTCASHRLRGVYSVAQLTCKQLFENIGSQCVAMRTSQSINWVDSLRKQWGGVNTKCIVNVQIIFQTQVPLYKLDTSIICCNVIVSTWDVSRKQIGDMADLVGRRHGRWEGEKWMVKVPFIRLVAVLCGNGGQRGIKTSSYFQKKCVYKCKKYKLGKKEQVFEKLCRHRPQTYPNIPKQLVAPGREGCGDPRPCTSRERLVTIPNVPMVAPRVFYLLGSQWRQNANLQLVEIVPAKKRNSCYDHDLDTSAISRGQL